MRPKLRRKQGGPFNGQAFRQKIFHELITQIKCSHIVETGTFRGLTTQFMHRQSGLPVLSGEVNPRFYSYAKRRLCKDKPVRLYNLDSRVFLNFLVGSSEMKDAQLFVYLDAHWADDLPLLAEMQIIFANFPDAVVMVDDFAVPGDAQYGYDDYGKGKALTLEYLEPAIKELDLQPYFPTAPAAMETGSRRGCVVLVRTPEKKMLLSKFDTIRAFVP